MADQRMKNDDLDRKLGGAGNEKGGQQSPGRSNQDDEPFGQRGGGQGTTGRNLEHDDRDSHQQGGRGTQTGKQGNEGGQNR